MWFSLLWLGREIILPHYWKQLWCCIENALRWEWWIILESDTGIVGKKEIRVLLSGVEPKTLRLLVRMLYHWASGDSWELSPLKSPVARWHSPGLKYTITFISYKLHCSQGVAGHCYSDGFTSFVVVNQSEIFVSFLSSRRRQRPSLETLFIGLVSVYSFSNYPVLRALDFL